MTPTCQARLGSKPTNFGVSIRSVKPPNNDDIADSPYSLPCVQSGIRCRRLDLSHARVQQRGAAGLHFLEAARDGGGNVGGIADLFAIGAERFGDLGEVHLRRQLRLEFAVPFASPSG